MRLLDLAESLQAELIGDGDTIITGVSSLSRSNEFSLTFYADSRRIDELKDCEAAAVVLRSDSQDLFAGNRLIVDQPYQAFIQACEILIPEEEPSNSCHPTVSVDQSASVGERCSMGPGCSIGRNSVLNSACSLGSNVSIGDNVSIGEGSQIASNVSIYSNTIIGANCRIESGAVIGSPGFGYLPEAEGWRRIPQIGRVVIGDRVDIGANTTIDRGSLDDTVIEDGVKLDNLIQVAHNVRIGRDSAIAGCTGIAGSARIGRRCRIGGRVSILGHLDIADDVQINATSVVTGSLKEPGTYSSNLTVQESGRWLKTVARLPQLDLLFRRVKKLEKNFKRFS